MICISVALLMAGFALQFPADSVSYVLDEEVQYVYEAAGPSYCKQTQGECKVSPWIEPLDERLSKVVESDLSGYEVGSIPLQSGVTQTGARYYNVPVISAPGYRFVPQISIYYNSQSGNGVAGYGWSIGGLSSIEVRPETIFYEGISASAQYTDPGSVYALDGIPIVSSERLVEGYELASARGNIQIHKHLNVDATPSYFDALYPDGSRAVLGYKDNESAQVSYPITEFEDIEGNRITFEYNFEGGVYYIKSIRYGLGGKMSFDYATARRPDSSPYRNTVAGRQTESNRRLLRMITVSDKSIVLCRYTLDYELKDEVNLLKSVRFTSGSAELPPLSFEYGVDIESPELSPGFQASQPRMYDWAYAKSDKQSLQYRRGRLLPGFAGDGVLVLPALSNYQITARKRGYPKYGSSYPPDTRMLVNKRGYYGSAQDFIAVGDGFQTVELLDIDGDGLDEIVKVNSNCSKKEVTDYKVTIYSYRSESRLDSTSFSFSIGDGTYNKYYNNPAKSEYFWGDFSGDGKAQLLVVTKKLSRFAIIDLNAKKKLSEETLFSRSDNDEQYMFVADLMGDGKSRLCYLADDAFRTYGIPSSGGAYLRLSRSYESLSRTKAAQSMSLLTGEGCRSVPVDVNGDGYMDVVSYPLSVDKNCTHLSNILNVSYFDGKTFYNEISRGFNRNVNSRLTFLDVDNDGLPDILNVQNDSLSVILNESGKLGTTSAVTSMMIGKSADLIPNAKSLWGERGDIILVDGHELTLYKYNIQHNDRRSLVQAIDSYGNIESNRYLSILVPGSFSEFGENVKFDRGYVSRPVPIDVLAQSISRSKERLLSDSMYYYEDAVYSLQGLGFCGFRSVKVSDAVSCDITLQTYDPCKFGVLKSVRINKIGESEPYLTEDMSYDSHTSVYGKLSPRLIEKKSSDYLTGKTTTVRYLYDKYGFPIVVTSQFALDGIVQSRVERYRYAYITMPDEYVLGVLLNSALDTDLDGRADSVWRVSKEYLREKYCHPIQQKTMVGRVKSGQAGESYIGMSLFSETKWEYDSTWNVISQKTAAYGAHEYIGDTYTYDVDGRYLSTSTDMFGHTTTFAGYDRWGNPAVQIDYKGNATNYEYNAFGHLIKTVYPDGAESSVASSWGGNGVYVTVSEGTDRPRVETCYNSIGDIARTSIQRFDGSIQIIDREYDNRGRLFRVSLPYKGKSSKYWTEYTYDAYNRPLLKIEPSGKRSEWRYDGSRVVSKVDGIVSTCIVDAMGNIVQAADEGGAIDYEYRDDGQLYRLTAPGGVVTSIGYDRFGRRVRIDDPCAGEYTYDYEIQEDASTVSLQTNSNGWVQTYSDKYGKVSKVVYSDGYDVVYSYDADGRLNSMISSNGCAKEFYYDRYDRVWRLKETVPDGKYLESTFGYRTGGQIDSIRYSSYRTYMATEVYQYANGYNVGVKLTDGTVVWHLNKENSLGQALELTTDGLKREYGYDIYGYPTYRRVDKGEIQNETYSFAPQTGNLLRRRESPKVEEEVFAYDNLNRLTSLNGLCVDYLPNGNILQMDGVGKMVYGDENNSYRLSGFYPESAGIGIGYQNVSYSCLNKPLAISGRDRRAEFVYGGDGSRVKMTEYREYSEGHVDKTYHWYIGDKYELVQYGNGYVDERLYLGGDAYTAPMMWFNWNDSWQIVRDYQGSVKQIVAPDGALSGNYSYDPWGRMRDAVTHALYSSGAEPKLFIGRGYCGHEHIFGLGLVNMNARLYDPVVGRFLSPDPVVQAPTFTQNLNRYTYVLNNPLKYTDQTGEVAVGMLISGALLGGVVNTIGHFSDSDWWKFFLAGATIGAVSSGVSSWIAGITQVAGVGGGALIGAVAGSVTGASTNYLLNGFNNMIEGHSFSNGWRPYVRAGAISGMISGAVSGAISGYNYAVEHGADPFTRNYKEVGNDYSPISAEVAEKKLKIKQEDPTKHCYAYAAEYADHGHGNRVASDFYKSAKSDGANLADVWKAVTENDAKILAACSNTYEWAIRLLNAGQEVFSTTNNHTFNIISMTIGHKLNLFGGGINSEWVLFSAKIFDPLSGGFDIIKKQLDGIGFLSF